MKRSDQINELAGALAKAQSIMEAATKDSNNPFFHSKYADLASCWAAWRQAGPPQGLALLQFATATEERLDPPITIQADGDRKAKTIHFIQRVSVETLLCHSSGQWVSEALTVLVKDDSPQSTILGETYCRRGGMAAMIGIAPEDDDGNEAGGHGADTGRRETVQKPDVPQCPECGRQGESVITDKFKGGFKCWEKRGGCGHHWLPADEQAPPEQPKANGKAAEVAAEHGLQTGSELEAAQKATFNRAMAAIQKAMRERDKEKLKRISAAASKDAKEGNLSREQDANIVNELATAEKKILAMEKEPVGA